MQLQGNTKHWHFRWGSIYYFEQQCSLPLVSDCSRVNLKFLILNRLISWKYPRLIYVSFQYRVRALGKADCWHIKAKSKWRQIIIVVVVVVVIIHQSSIIIFIHHLSSSSWMIWWMMICINYLFLGIWLPWVGLAWDGRNLLLSWRVQGHLHGNEHCQGISQSPAEFEYTHQTDRCHECLRVHPLLDCKQNRPADTDQGKLCQGTWSTLVQH